MTFFKVSEAASSIRRSASWLRQAEKKGKLPMAKRDLNGWRVYTEEDLQRLRKLLVPNSQEYEEAKPTS